MFILCRVCIISVVLSFELCVSTSSCTDVVLENFFTNASQVEGSTVMKMEAPKDKEAVCNHGHSM